MAEIEQEKEEKEEEKARMSGMLILSIAFKTTILVEEAIQHRLKIKLCWGTPYMGPVNNKMYINEIVCDRLKPKLKPMQLTRKIWDDKDEEKEDVDEIEQEKEEKEEEKARISGILILNIALQN